jgi:PPM family protein phosphatase
MRNQELKPTAEAACLPASRFRVEANWASDRGNVRSVNEDSACVVVPDNEAERERKGVLLVVADGMGGHQGGELASRMIVERVQAEYYRISADPGSALAGAVRAANREVLVYTRQNPQFAGMGATCVAAAVARGLAWLAHVGDSRLYLVRGGGAYRMTQDHSAAMELVRLGVLTLDQADHHENRNLILRAVGTRQDLEISTWKQPFPLQVGDRLVLCSDGMYESIPDREIAELSATNNATAACAALVQLALERDGTDNITVAVLRVLDMEGAQWGN